MTSSAPRSTLNAVQSRTSAGHAATIAGAPIKPGFPSSRRTIGLRNRPLRPRPLRSWWTKPPDLFPDMHEDEDGQWYELSTFQAHTGELTSEKQATGDLPALLHGTSADGSERRLRLPGAQHNGTLPELRGKGGPVTGGPGSVRPKLRAV
jgi:hypothetical protein